MDLLQLDQHVTQPILGAIAIGPLLQGLLDTLQVLFDLIQMPFVHLLYALSRNPVAGFSLLKCSSERRRHAGNNAVVPVNISFFTSSLGPKASSSPCTQVLVRHLQQLLVSDIVYDIVAYTISSVQGQYRLRDEEHNKTLRSEVLA